MLQNFAAEDYVEAVIGEGQLRQVSLNTPDTIQIA
jgi:hypothetical protein